MRRNATWIAAAVLLITAILLRGTTLDMPPDMSKDVYIAEITGESEDAASPEKETRPDEPDVDEPGIDEPGIDEPDAGEPESDAGEPEPDAGEPESGANEPEPDFEAPAAMPPMADDSAEIEIEGNQTDIAGAMPPEAAIGGEEESGGEQQSEAEENEPEPGIGELKAQFAAISPTEAVVKTYLELRNALANDNGITAVYFGANITMQAGIKIHPKKAGVIIDGLNPLDLGQSQPYTLTDVDSASFYDTIYVDEAGTKSIHVRNLKITGKNYYGPVSVYDMASITGVVITYERVDYNGPQLCYNRRGTVRLAGCSARIHGGNGALSPHQEFSEVKHLVFEKENTIDTVTNLYSVFWHPLGGSFTVSDDSSLTINSPNTSTAFGVFFADSYLYDVDISIGSRAVLDMTVSGVVAPELYVTLNSLTVHEGGAFYLTTTKTATATVLRVGGPLTVEKDAEFFVAGYGGAAYALLRQENGDIAVHKDAMFHITAESPYQSLLNLVGRAFLCDDVSSVLLLNGRRDIQASTAAGRVFVNAQQVNYWDAVTSGGFDNPPRYRWTKADTSNVEIDGTLSYYANTNFSSISSNHLTTDPPGVSPDATTFSMVDARVLAFGRLPLIVAGPTAQSTAIGGATEAGAWVRVSFTQQGQDYTLPDVQSDSEGAFHIPTGVALQSGTVVRVQSSWNYLSQEAEVTVGGEGRLLLFVPDTLEFYTTPLSAYEKTVSRVNPEWKVIVSDTRGTGGKWSLYAHLEGPMEPDASGLPALEDALIFVDESGKKETMYSGSDVLIRKHTSASGEDVFPVHWDSGKGILLTVKPGAAFSDTRYTADITWTLVDGV